MAHRKGSPLSEAELKYHSRCANDISGMRFGKLVAIKKVGKAKNRCALWLFKCDCGNETTKTSSNAISSKNRGSISGCATCFTIKHGASRRGIKSRIYQLWSGMVARCTQKNHIAYKYYGAKGITVCREWLNFDGFRNWALANGYANNLSIDRVDSKWRYDPSNCEWVSLSENSSRRHRKYWRSVTLDTGPAVAQPVNAAEPPWRSMTVNA